MSKVDKQTQQNAKIKKCKTQKKFKLNKMEEQQNIAKCQK